MCFFFVREARFIEAKKVQDSEPLLFFDSLTVFLHFKDIIFCLNFQTTRSYHLFAGSHIIQQVKNSVLAISKEQILPRKDSGINLF